MADQSVRARTRSIGFSVDARASAERVWPRDEMARGCALSRTWRRFAAPEEVKLVGKLDRVKSLRCSRRGNTRVPTADFGGIEVKGRTSPRCAACRPPDRTERAEQALLAELVEPPAARVALRSRVCRPLPPRAAERAANEARALLSAPVTLFSTDPALSWSLAPLELAPSLRAEPHGASLRLAFAPEVLAVALERVRREIEAEPVNAKFEVDAANLVTIVPSRSGLRVEWPAIPAALIAASQSASRSAALPLLHTPEPALRTDRAEALGIRGLVSSFTTRHPCCEKRVANIHRIADMLDGTLVEPGQTASVNALVGPRTLKAGFVPAPRSEEGEMVTRRRRHHSFRHTLSRALHGLRHRRTSAAHHWFRATRWVHEQRCRGGSRLIIRNDTTPGCDQ